MIEMRDAGEAQLSGVSERLEDVDERDRIRSARHGRDHAGARGDQIMLADEVTNAVNQGVHRGRVGRVGQVGRVGPQAIGASDLPDLPGLSTYPDQI